MKYASVAYGQSALQYPDYCYLPERNLQNPWVTRDDWRVNFEIRIAEMLNGFGVIQLWLMPARGTVATKEKLAGQFPAVNAYELREVYRDELVQEVFSRGEPSRMV